MIMTEPEEGKWLLWRLDEVGGIWEVVDEGTEEQIQSMLERRREAAEREHLRTQFVAHPFGVEP